MRLSDIVVLSWRQLTQRRLRSVLTVLAVAVGVITIVALSAQVEGVSASIFESFEKLGPSTIIVSVRGRTPFTDADVMIMESLEGVAKAMPILTTGVRVPNVDSVVPVIGISSVDLIDFLGEFQMRDGNIFFDAPAPQAVLGYNIAVDASGQVRYQAGQPVLGQASQRTFMLTAVGILDLYGTATVVQPDNSIFVPLDYLKQVLRSSSYSLVVVKAANSEQVEAVSELISYAFSGLVSITSIKQITSTVVQITGQVNLLLLGIAGTSFIAAGLGTLNIMMISVLERVREIGIFKALGMRDKEVLSIYVLQGGLIALLGISVGMLLGVSLAYVLPVALGGLRSELAPGTRNALGTLAYEPKISPVYIAVASLVSIVVTLLSSSYPAWRASKLRPVEALKYE